MLDAGKVSQTHNESCQDNLNVPGMLQHEQLNNIYHARPTSVTLQKTIVLYSSTSFFNNTARNLDL